MEQPIQPTNSTNYTVNHSDYSRKSFLHGFFIPVIFATCSIVYRLIDPFSFLISKTEFFYSTTGYLFSRLYLLFIYTFYALNFILPVLTVLAFIVTPIYLGKRYGSEFRIQALKGSLLALLAVMLISGFIKKFFQ